MLRRTFFNRITGLMTMMGLATLPLAARPEKEIIPGRFVHMVFFWLRDPEDADAFISATENFLQKIDVVRSYHLGKPAGTPREVVDNSYSVSLVVTFDSKEDQDVYQDHPAHVAYVSQNKSKWSHVQIYDSWGKV